MKLFIFLVGGFRVLLGVQFPEQIDFSKCPYIDTYFDEEASLSKKLADKALILGTIAFNEAPEMGPFFLMLKEEYGIDTVIETGTHQGFTTSFFGNWFDNVHTIEIAARSYHKAVHTFGSYSNVHCHFGSSEKVLRDLLPTIQGKRILFYLDAHWESYWPLLDELAAIAKSHKDNCIIVIDDVQVPGHPDIPFDQYGSDICRLEYFEKGLNLVFTEFSGHYLIPKASSSHAKFVAVPKIFSKDTH